jgi:pyruvate kinase
VEGISGDVASAKNSMICVIMPQIEAAEWESEIHAVRRPTVQTPDHKTKIVCTIGPASESPEMMRRLIEAGMDVARLNFSHGEFASHQRVVERLRATAAAAGRRVAIMADLPGPKMRIGSIAPEPVELKAGDPFVLTTEEIVGDRGRVSMTFERLPQVVKPGTPSSSTTARSSSRS